MLQFYDRRLLLLSRSRVEAVELNAGVSGGKAPVDQRFGLVAASLPCRNLTAQGCHVGHPTGQALFGERRELAFRHVEPTPMLGGVVKFQLAGEPPRFGWRKGFIEGGGRMRVEM